MKNANLPEEILFNHILCRLPVRSILCLRSVCKAWSRMLREQQFVKLHLKIHEQQACNDKKKKLLIRTKITNFSDFNGVGTKQSSYYSIDCESRVAASPPEVPGVVVSETTHLLGSCNGLVAIIVQDDDIMDDPDSIVLWNPSTGESKRLTHTLPTMKLSNLFGFVYDSTTDDYKIICMGIIMHKESHVDIYSFRNDSWKKIKGLPCKWNLSVVYYWTQVAGVEVNGYFYWMVKLYRQGESYPFILGFSLKDEKLIYLKLPCDEMCENYSGSYNNATHLGLKALGRNNATHVGLKAMGRSCIAAFRFYMNDKLLVWTSKDPEKQENKWEKLITLSLSSPELKFTCSIRPLWFTKDGKVLLIIGFRGDKDQHQPNFGVYDPQKKSLEFVQIDGMKNTSCVMLTTEMEYIPSLVSPNMFESGMRQVIDTSMPMDIGAKKRKWACP